MTIQLGDVIDRATAARVQALSRSISQAALPGVVETVPTCLSLTVHYDPLDTTFTELVDQIAALPDTEAGVQSAPGRAWELPICFEDDAFCPDLAGVAEWAGLGVGDVMADLLATELFVYMIGFAPGQPYMGDLPDRLAIPRRKTPVQSIPTGSVVVATGKAIIYPVANPTGWHVVGRTPVALFDMSRAAPFLLEAGDTVRFAKVGRAEFVDIRQRSLNGTFDALNALQA